MRLRTSNNTSLAKYAPALSALSAWGIPNLALRRVQRAAERLMIHIVNGHWGQNLAADTSGNYTLRGCVDDCHGAHLKTGLADFRWHFSPQAEKIRGMGKMGVVHE